MGEGMTLNAGRQKTIASPVFAVAGRDGVGTVEGLAREPLPSRCPDSMTVRRSLASRQAPGPEIIHRDMPRPLNICTSHLRTTPHVPWEQGMSFLLSFIYFIASEICCSSG